MTTECSTGGVQAVAPMNGNPVQSQGVFPAAAANQPNASNPYIPYAAPVGTAIPATATVTDPLPSGSAPKKGALDTLKELGTKTGKGYTNLVVGNHSSLNRVEVFQYSGSLAHGKGD